MTSAVVATAAACLPLTVSLTISSSQKKESEHIVGSFVPVVQEKMLQKNRLQLPVNNVISNVPVFIRTRTLLPVVYFYLEKSLADDGSGVCRLAFFSSKSIPSKTQTGLIEGVITSFKNELYFLSQIAYSTKNYLHIFTLVAALLNQKNKNNSNWTRFIQPVTSPQEQNIKQITKEFAYFYEDSQLANVRKTESIGGRSQNNSADNDGGGNASNENGGRKSSSSSSKSTQIGPGRASEKWLLANHDSNANIYTISSGISLADLYQDGDYRLLIGDIGFTGSPKLKVYHGTYLQCENLLVDIPCGVVVVHNDKPELTTSVIVASGSYLFVYRNLKPFYKFSLPPLETNKIESDAWTRYKDMRINVGTLEEILNNLRLEIGRRRLTSRSQMLLSLISAETKTLFAESFKNHPLKKMNVITCMATLKKTVSDANAPSCLILGTENQEAYILEIDAYTILSTATLPSVPVFIEASGLFDVEYRILFACRDAHIYLIKRGYSSGRLCIQLNSHPVGLARIGSNIYVACMDHTLSIFTTKGNRVWNMKQPAAITTMEAIFLERQGLHIIAVALANKKVMFYNDRKCVDILHMHDIVVAMKFGRFGREDNTLVMVSKRGALTVKILKRTAKFIAREYEEEASKAASGSAAGKLIVPKKTKLFVDQTMREREQYLAIHKSFEHELMRLKLNAARTYVKALQSSLNPISLNTSDSIKLSAKVFGLGPIFQLNLELQNSNGDNFPTDLMMVFEYDAKIYRLEKNVIQIACLLATATYRYTNRVHCISEMNLSDAIKIYILYENEEVPLVTAVINMPRSELETLPESDATNQRPPLGETNQF